MFSLILDLYNIDMTNLIDGIVVKAIQKDLCCRFCMNLEAFLQHEIWGYKTPIILTRVREICWTGFGCWRMENGPKRAKMGLRKMGRRQSKRVLPIVVMTDYQVEEWLIQQHWHSTRVRIFYLREKESEAPLSRAYHRQKLQKRGHGNWQWWSEDYPVTISTSLNLVLLFSNLV